MIHPNYSTYLIEKYTLTLEALDEIFDMVDPEKSVEYDEEYIEGLYIEYLSRRDQDDSSIKEIAANIAGRKILIIAPGKRVVDEKEKLIEFYKKEKPVVFSINHDYPYLPADTYACIDFF